MPTPRIKSLIVAIASFGGLYSANAQISYISGTYQQNFDTLPTATVAAFIPAPVGSQAGIPAPDIANPLLGWSGGKVAGSNTTTAQAFTADTGTTGSGFLYSYGMAGSSERALGALASGSNVYGFGAAFKNESGGTITAITISFTAEFWRNSTVAQNILAFSYGVAGGTLDSTNYLTAASPAMTAFTALNVTGPTAVTTQSALDGNLAANQATVTATITGLSIPNNTTFFIRWQDANDGGNDAGLAIDNFSLSAQVSNGVDVTVGSGDTFTPTSLAGTAFTSEDTALFNQTAKTITLVGNVEATALKFTADYTLAGSPTDSIALTGSITVDNTANAIISGIVAGTSGLSKLGTGTLTLTGANTVSGPINIVAGTLVAPNDAALGNSENDVAISGIFSTSSSSFTFGSGRSISGAGSIVLPSASTLTFGGPIASGNFTVTGANTINLQGLSNVLTGLTLAEATTINVTGGDLQLGASGLTLNQTTGTTTIAGNLVTGGDRTILVNSGILQPTGNVTLGGRIIKTGAGTLDMTAANVAGSTSTTGGYRFGVQGTTPVEGGVLKVDSAAALGNAQLQFNSGTLELVGDLTSTIGISVGGRNAGGISEPTITGGNLTLSGTNSFFNTGSSTNDILFNVTNTTTLSGAYAPTSTTAITPVWVGVGGTGTLILSGDATRIIDYYIATDTVTLVINGSLGGEVLRIESGATLSGNGTFTGSSPWEDTNPTSSTNTLTQPATPIYVASTSNIFGTLAPSGVLTLRASTTLESGSKTILQVNGLTRGTEYDAITVETPAGTTFSYNLNYGGELILDFGNPAKNGTYALFTAGNGTTFGGGFAVDAPVKVTGAHTGTLTKNGSIWSGTFGATFSFDESTGILTVTGGAAATTALEDWRQTNFGSTANTGSFADSADFDNDGIANLVEYATGTSPTTANANPVTVATKNNAGQFLTLSFNRINDPTLTYTILASNDLTGGFTSTGTTYTGSAAGTVVYEDTVSLTTPGVRRFLSLQVSYGTP